MSGMAIRMEDIAERGGLRLFVQGELGGSLEEKMRGWPGILEVHFEDETGWLEYSYNPFLTNSTRIIASLRLLGYEVREEKEAFEGRADSQASFAGVSPLDFPDSKSSVIRLEGLDCADCAAKLERTILAMSGVKDAQVSFAAAKMKINHQIPLSEILKVIEKMGYRGRAEGAAGAEEKISIWKSNKYYLSTLLSGMLLLIAVSLQIMQIPETWVHASYLLAIVLGGYLPARAGLALLLTSWEADMNLLMILAASGAVAIGQLAEAAVVVFLFSLGNALQGYSMDKTRNSVRALMDLAPPEALVRRNGREQVIPVESIVVGDIFIVRPGEKIAMDGVILKGSSALNEASITGESIPVDKGPGERVYAGTMNSWGALEVEVERLAEDNTINRIIAMIEEAEEQRAPSQQFVDRFARYYTPAVILAAILVALLPPLLFGQPGEKWFYEALAMLLVACPCALIISTPVAIVSAIGTAARNGVLVKGGVHLEEMGRIKVLAFDKTGTLTRGKPRITDIISSRGLDKNEVLRRAASLEARSEHPLAETVVEQARKLGLELAEVSNFRAMSGRGAAAEIEGKSCYVGNQRLFSEVGIAIQGQEELIAELEGAGKTLILLGDEKELLGIIALADELRENSREAIRQLKKKGIKKSIILSGDNERAARAMALSANVDEYRAGLLPEGKVQAIRTLLEKHEKVAMVGDGVNDAPALAISTVGIAMGVAGSDAALETADIALMADDLSRLPYTVELGRRTLRIIRQNIVFSLLLKAIILSLVIPGWLTLWLAVAGDMGTSLLVTLNGMRLTRVKAEAR